MTLVGRLARAGAPVALVAPLLAATPALGQAAAGGDALGAAMARCAAIENDEERHACTDAALREAGLLRPRDPAKAAEERRRTFGLPKTAPAPPATLQAAPPPPPATVQAAPAPPAAAGQAGPAQPAPAAAPPAVASPAPRPEQRVEDPDRVEVTLSRVVDRGDGRLLLTTTDGAEWYQADAGSVRPTPAQGQTMTIQRGALGRFTCKTGRWTTFRCLRRR